MAATHVNSEEFVVELQTELPVVVDFWAQWCGPCRAISPVLDDLADKYDGSVKVLKVDVMENKELAKQYGVSSIPFIGVFKDGQLVESQVGFSGRGAIEELFEALVK